MLTAVGLVTRAAVTTGYRFVLDRVTEVALMALPTSVSQVFNDAHLPSSVVAGVALVLRVRLVYRSIPWFGRNSRGRLRDRSSGLLPSRRRLGLVGNLEEEPSGTLGTAQGDHHGRR